jgi:polyisoprenoid-binding protein YceI
MKIRTLIAGGFALLMAAALPVQGADQTIIYRSSPSGSKMKIEGTANMIHTTWWVQATFIIGSLQVGPGFPTEPGQAVTPGRVEAQATNVAISVRALKSVEKDEKPYDEKMDEIMYDHLKADKYPMIVYRLKELTLKEAPKSQDAPYVMDAKGELAIAGITNPISMTVNVLPLEGKKLKITGSTSVKMSDYKVGPVAPKIALGIIKTGDDVKLNFEWMLIQRAPPRAAASK